MSGSPSKYRGGKIPIPSGFQPRSPGVKKSMLDSWQPTVARKWSLPKDFIDAKFLSWDVENKYLYIYSFLSGVYCILYFTCKPFTYFQLIFFFFFSLVFFFFFYALLFFFFSFFLFFFFFSFFFFNFSCFFFCCFFSSQRFPSLVSYDFLLLFPESDMNNHRSPFPEDNMYDERERERLVLLKIIQGQKSLKIIN